MYIVVGKRRGGSTFVQALGALPVLGAVLAKPRFTIAPRSGGLVTGTALPPIAPPPTPTPPPFDSGLITGGGGGGGGGAAIGPDSEAEEEAEGTVEPTKAGFFGKLPWKWILIGGAAYLLLRKGRR